MRYCNEAAITDAIFVNLRGIEELDMVGCAQDAVTSAGFEQLRGIETLIVDESKHLLLAAILNAQDTSRAKRLIDVGDTMWINAAIGFMGPLQYASLHGLDAVVLRLLRRGANVNAAALNGGTGALYWACMRGSESTAYFLLKWGADVNQRTSYGQTPIQCAQSDTLKALLRSAGALD